MSKAEAFEVNFGENKSIGVNVNFSKGDAIQVPVSINSLDAEKVAKEVGDRIAEKLDETALASVAKESTLLVESQRIQDAVRNIDLSPIENKIDNIKLPEIDTTELAKESTLNAVSSKLDNLNMEVDLSNVAKQGENQEATNSNILTALNGIATTMYRGIPVVTHDVSESSTSYITILPNRYNIVNIQYGTNLVVIKGEEEQGIVNNYMMCINANGTLNSMTFNGWELVWYGGTAPSVKQEKLKLELCIIDNLVLWTKF